MSVRLSKRVVVTGFSSVCSLGNGALHSWKRLLAGESGIVRDTNPANSKLPGQVWAPVAYGKGKHQFDLEKEWKEIEKGGKFPEPRHVNTSCVLAIANTRDALTMAKLLPLQDKIAENTGVSIGFGWSNLQQISEDGLAIRNGGLEKASNLSLNAALNIVPAASVSIQYNFKGPLRAVMTACATGVSSVGDAFRLVRNGDAEVMVAGAADGYGLMYHVRAGFCKMRALTTKYNDKPQNASRPFDEGRDGFVIAEGAGMLILEELEHAKKRGAKIWAEVLGYGLSGDSHHLSASPPDGNGAYRAMRASLRDAGVEPAQVGHVNCHATSTPVGDRAECQALSRLFGERFSQVRLAATKSAHGHLQGATGALESIWTVLAVHDGQVPSLHTLEKIDHDIAAMQHKPRLVTGRSEKWEEKRRIAIKNSFGFGGVNAALVFSNYLE